VYTLQIRARLSNGRTSVSTRRYRTCVKPSLSTRGTANINVR
jgi:hypothetical protein